MSVLYTLDITMHTREKGNQGETIACKFLENKGFTIIARNYQKKWGEIDIIAQKDFVPHFVEVKSVTSSHFGELSGIYRPEDNVHAFKLKHIRRMVETYFLEQGMGLESEFYFHVLCVFMNTKIRRARVKWIQNLIL